MTSPAQGCVKAAVFAQPCAFIFLCLSDLFGCQLSQQAYNSNVPTPFYHLSIAVEVLQHPSLEPAVRRLLEDQRGEFLFGNTAPDVQVVSGQPREITHFFDLPIHPNDPPAWLHMQQRYPELSGRTALLPSRRAFLAGYMCHLQADWNWVMKIFMPVFGLRSHWETFGKRLYLHNVLRSYLDREYLPNLSNGSTACLGSAQPDGWLPFVDDRYLLEWRVS